MKLYYDKADYDDQLKRTASAAYCGAADLGEMLVAASAVKLGDAGSWYREWATAAKRAEALAQSSAAHRERMVAGVRVLAASLFLRPQRSRR